MLHKLIDGVMKGLDEANKKHGSEHGFIGLLIRDPTLGNIDIMHNCTNNEDIIKILQLTIDQLQEKSSKKKSDNG
jgi:hypothetical protein